MTDHLKCYSPVDGSLYAERALAGAGRGLPFCLAAATFLVFFLTALVSLSLAARKVTGDGPTRDGSGAGLGVNRRGVGASGPASRPRGEGAAAPLRTSSNPVREAAFLLLISRSFV